MNKFIQFLTNRRLSANIITFSVIAIGVWSIYSLPLAEKPLVELGKGTITTIYPGASAEDVEVNINSKLEKELLSVSGIKTFQSSAELGFSKIDVELKPSVKDVKSAYQDIRDAITRVSDLPSGVTGNPVLSVKKSSNLDFMVVGISSKTSSYYDLRKEAKQVELGLRRIEGIGEVHLMDMRDLEHLIELEAEQVKRYGFTLNQIADEINKANVLSSGGSLRNSELQADIVVTEELKTPELLGEMVISKNPKVKLSDITENIKAGTIKTSSYFSLNGDRAIGFDLRTADGADVTDTAKRIKDFIANEQLRLADDYSITIGFDLSAEISQKFSIIKSNGLVGMVLVILSLAFFLNRRIAIPVALSMPFCMFGALSLLPLLGQILDSYTLAALLLIMGIIVDDAVVIGENISARHSRGESLKDATVNGLSELIPSVSISILTTIVAFLPLLSVPGNTGKMLYVMPLVIVLALIFSFIDVVFVLPSHVKHALGGQVLNNKNETIKEDLWITKLRQPLQKIISHRFKVVASFVIIASILGYISFKNIPYIFFPSSGAYLIEVAVDVDGTANIDTAWKNTRAVERIFADNKEVKSWYGTVGLPTSVWTITLTPVADRSVSADDIVAEMEKEIKKIKQIVSVEFDIDTGGAPVGKPIEVQVVGGSDENRDRLTSDLVIWLEEQSGVIRVHRASTELRPQIIADINHELISAHGVSVSDISRILKIAVDGERVGRVFLDGEEIFLRVLLEEYDRNLDNLLSLDVLTSDNQHKTLNNFISWRENGALLNIKHYNGLRSTKVTAGVSFGVTDPVRVESAMRDYFSKIDGYGGARLISTGQAQSSQEALVGLSIAMMIAIGAIFCLLLLLFDNYTESLVAISIVPFGIVSSLFFLWIHNESLSFFAIVGTIGLTGIMINNALILVRHYKSQQDSIVIKTISHQEITDFVVAGAISRARAVVITSVTTILGMIPLAYGLGGYDNFMGPIALVIGWGVLISMFSVLVFIPSLYSATLTWKKFFMKVKNTETAKAIPI